MCVSCQVQSLICISICIYFVMMLMFILPEGARLSSTASEPISLPGRNATAKNTASHFFCICLLPLRPRSPKAICAEGVWYGAADGGAGEWQGQGQTEAQEEGKGRVRRSTPVGAARQSTQQCPPLHVQANTACLVTFCRSMVPPSRKGLSIFGSWRNARAVRVRKAHPIAGIGKSY